MTLHLDSYPNSLTALRRNMEHLPRPSALAESLVEGAIGFDTERASRLGLHFKYKGLVRDAANPAEFEHEEVEGMPWADKSPVLGLGEWWNAGRRATLTGAAYALDTQGRPVNPYMNTGMSGRGTLGLYGPNHAVDNGIMAVRDEGLSILGITRKYDGNAPAMAGGFAKFEKRPDGAYAFDAETEKRSRADEFFEEMISGSIELLPEFADRLDASIAEHIAGIEAQRNGRAVSVEERAHIAEEVKTELKMAQVQQYDPEFLQRLHAHIAQGRECFAGPVLCDPRNTNTAWIESRVACVVFNEKVWDDIRGSDPKFDYALAGGDDASDAVWHVFTPQLIETAFASHGAMMTFLATMFVVDTLRRGSGLAPNVMAQLDGVENFLRAYRR